MPGDLRTRGPRLPGHAGIIISEFQHVAGYDEENFDKTVAQFVHLLEPQVIADGIHCLLTLPSHVNITGISIHPQARDSRDKHDLSAAEFKETALPRATSSCYSA